jgi:hypothetical protein
MVRGWPVQVEGDQEQQGDECGGEQHREHPTAEDRQVEPEQSKGDGRAGHLIQARGAGGGRGIQGPARVHNWRWSWWPSAAAWRAAGVPGTECDSRMLVSV